MENYSIEEQALIGKRLATLFLMKRDPEHHERFKTLWGTKTPLGIYHTFKRLGEDIENGNILETLKF